MAFDEAEAYEEGGGQISAGSGDDCATTEREESWEMHGGSGECGSWRERACSDSCVLGVDDFGAGTQDGLICGWISFVS